MKASSMLAATAMIAALAGGAQAASTTKVTGGQIEGVTKGGSVAFLGVPFAAPPTGPLRWRAPVPATPWKGVRKTVEFSASCPQILNSPEGRAPWTPEYLIPGPMSEDCLYLNVWKPAKAVKGAPILVWFHGGGLTEGSGSVPVYDGAALASRGVIVVSVNYRLGVLGFLAHPALSAEQGGTSGNYGLEDAIAALRWVKANAAAFGGDPKRVTIAGQSAGSGLVNDLTGAPMAKGLFSRTIAESGSGWNAGPPTLAAAETNGKAFAEKIGAPSLAALRAIPAEELFKKAVAANAHFGVAIDGPVLPADPIRAQASHAFNDTPALSGINADEDSGFDTSYGQWSADALAKKRQGLFGPVDAQAAKFYTASSDAQAHDLGKTMARERSRAYVYEWARHRAPATRYPIYTYYNEHPEPGPTQARYGTFHTDEVPYVFHNLQAPRPFTDDDRKFADEMSARWIAFIKGGSPNAAGLARWAAFDPKHPMTMHLGVKEGMEPVLPDDKLRLADDLVDKAGSLSPR